MTDRQGFNAGWDHWLCEIPPAASEGSQSSSQLLLLILSEIIFHGRVDIWLKIETSFTGSKYE